MTYLTPDDIAKKVAHWDRIYLQLHEAEMLAVIQQLQWQEQAAVSDLFACERTQEHLKTELDVATANLNGWHTAQNAQQDRAEAAELGVRELLCALRELVETDDPDVTAWQRARAILDRWSR
jgi:hypothetical protein